jgi:two-component system sensor histidine kinase TctE
LLLALVGPLTLLFLLGGAASWGLAQYFADTVYDGWLFDSVSSLALEVEATEKGPFVDLPQETQRLFEWDATDRTYFRISGARKGLIAGRADWPPMAGDVDEYEGVRIYDLFDQFVTDVLEVDMDGAQGARLYDGRMDGQDVRVAAIELPASDFGEAVTVEVAETTRKRRGLAQAILLSTLVPQLLLIGVAAAAVRRAIRHGLDPLNHIAQRLQSRGYQQLAPIVEAGVPEEVQPLTRALNDLLSRLASALNAQRRFLAEAAHQLRTPLTAIKLHAEQIGRESTLHDAAPLLDALRVSTDRAARLSNQLLTLARAEPDGSAARPFRRLDLASLVRETGSEWAPQALSVGLDMHFSCETEDQPVWIQGDADLLREALNNLIDNAMKYHGGHGSLHLRVFARPRPGVSVEDDGPGIPAPLRAQMLQRFVRGERGAGSGLGLSIAQEIACLHGGELTLEDGPAGRGLRVRLRL